MAFIQTKLPQVMQMGHQYYEMVRSILTETDPVSRETLLTVVNSQLSQLNQLLEKETRPTVNREQAKGNGSSSGVSNGESVPTRPASQPTKPLPHSNGTLNSSREEESRVRARLEGDEVRAMVEAEEAEYRKARSSPVRELPSDWRTVVSRKAAHAKDGSKTLEYPDRDDRNQLTEEYEPKRIHLRNLAPNMNKLVIRDYFQRYGVVADVKVYDKIYDGPNGQPYAIGVVEFTDDNNAKKALEVSQHLVGERVVSVERMRRKALGRDGKKSDAKYQVFLGGVPSFRDDEEVIEDIEKYGVRVRALNRSSGGGYAMPELSSESDVVTLLEAGFIEIKDKTVEVQRIGKNRAERRFGV